MVIILRQLHVENYAMLHTSDDIKGFYEEATAVAVNSAPMTPVLKRSRADWENDQRDLQEEQANLKALRNHEVPPYFESELGKAFLLSQVLKAFCTPHIINLATFDSIDFSEMILYS